jgi:hypothetical protein
MRHEAAAKFDSANHFGDLCFPERFDSVDDFRRGKERNRTDLCSNAPRFAIIRRQAKTPHRTDGEAECFAIIQFRGQCNVKRLLLWAFCLACT